MYSFIAVCLYWDLGPSIRLHWWNHFFLGLDIVLHFFYLQEAVMEEEEERHLPLDIIYKIPEYISDPVSLARVASSSKLWRSIIKETAFLDGLMTRHLDHGFTSSLLLGFFYQDSAEAPDHLWQHHRDKNRCLAPSFMPMSELSKSIGSKVSCNALTPAKLCTFIRGLGCDLNLYQPIASQDSLLALRRQGTSDQAQSDKLCVCNPLTGEIFHIPSIQITSPDMYTLSPRMSTMASAYLSPSSW